MRFMLLMIPKVYQPGAEVSPQDQAGAPSAEQAAAMSRFNEDLQKGGHVIALDGLHPLAAGARIAFEGGKPVVTDGPDVKAKEVLGGYWMLQFASKAEAIEWAKRCPAADGDVLELRQAFEMSDFPDEVVEAVHENAPELVKAHS